jgi:hypothetical protein
MKPFRRASIKRRPVNCTRTKTPSLYEEFCEVLHQLKGLDVLSGMIFHI